MSLGSRNSKRETLTALTSVVSQSLLSLMIMILIINDYTVD